MSTDGDVEQPDDQGSVYEANPDPGETIFKHFARISKDYKCHICQNNYWWILDERENRAPLSFIGGKKVAAYSVACSKCGVITQFVSDIVDGNVADPRRGMLP